MVIDHLVYGTPDAEATAAGLARSLGTPPIFGGTHPGRGTQNWILPLAPRTYLEIIGPDPSPSNPAPAGGRPYGIDRLSEPRLVAWGLEVASARRARTEARRDGYDPGPVQQLSRSQADGNVLAWRLTRWPDGRIDGDGLVPFLIEWGAAAHPAAMAPCRAALTSFHGEHPQPRLIEIPLRAVGARLPVREAPATRLVAVLRGPLGTVQID
jgi:hypothetical protein